MAKLPKQGQRWNWIQHLLNRPDTKIGSINTSTESVWTFCQDKCKIKKCEIQYNTAFEQTIMEPISNAMDNKWESDKMGVTMTFINFTCDQESGRITLKNDGRWIPVELQEWPYTNPKTQKTTVDTMYPAEVYFGEDLSGTNYDDTEVRMTSGKNGIGAKATNVFSKEFKVTCVDPVNNKKFTQIYKNNMRDRGKISVTNCKTKNGYTEISWIPDYERFGFTGLTDEWIGLIKKHARSEERRVGKECRSRWSPYH